MVSKTSLALVIHPGAVRSVDIIFPESQNDNIAAWGRAGKGMTLIHNNDVLKEIDTDNIDEQLVREVMENCSAVFFFDPKLWK